VTVIIADLLEDGRVRMTGDSGLWRGDTFDGVLTEEDAKVFKAGRAVVGYCGKLESGLWARDLLRGIDWRRGGLDQPDGLDPLGAITRALKKAEIHEAIETDGTALDLMVGYDGRVYHVYGSGAYFRLSESRWVIGDAEMAHGALLVGATPVAAMDAQATYGDFCRRPFVSVTEGWDD
jgi:hypothetical protein